MKDCCCIIVVEEVIIYYNINIHTQGKFLQIVHTFTAAVSMLKNITRIII